MSVPPGTTTATLVTMGLTPTLTIVKATDLGLGRRSIAPFGVGFLYTNEGFKIFTEKKLCRTVRKL